MANTEALYTNKIFLCGALPLLKTIVADVPSLKSKFENIHCVYQVSCLDPEAPEGKYAWTATVGEKGQIVIPKEAREMFSINPGDSMVVLCDKKRGMAIVKSEVLEDKIEKIISR